MDIGAYGSYTSKIFVSHNAVSENTSLAAIENACGVNLDSVNSCTHAKYGVNILYT